MGSRHLSRRYRRYGPDPNEVVEKSARSTPSPFTAITIKPAAASKTPPISSRRARRGPLDAKLTPEISTTSVKLPTGPIQLDGMALVHGALRDEDEYVFTQAQALEGLLEAPLPVTFFGHTHLQGGFILDETNVEVVRLKVPPGMGSAKIDIADGKT